MVCVAGIFRERMLFNMSEEEWDAVVETHLKGHFTMFRAASAIMRKQEGGGSLVAFTSGAFAGSVAQANYAAAKGGVVSLVRSAAAGLNRYGITANAIAPVARTRMSANVPMELRGDGRPRRRRTARRLPPLGSGQHVTGQVYTAVGPKIAVWNQPVRSERCRRRGDGRPRRSPNDSTRRSVRSAWASSTVGRDASRRPRRGTSPTGELVGAHLEEARQRTLR